VNDYEPTTRQEVFEEFYRLWTLMNELINSGAEREIMEIAAQNLVDCDHTIRMMNAPKSS
jgi:hypothetical protein